MVVRQLQGARDKCAESWGVGGYVPIQDRLMSYASILTHGILWKFPGGTTQFLRADGTYASPDLIYSPGSFTVATETYRQVGPHLKLTGSQRMTVQGTGRVRGSN
jgi:hypothetical protein